MVPNFKVLSFSHINHSTMFVTEDNELYVCGLSERDKKFNMNGPKIQLCKMTDIKVREVNNNTYSSMFISMDDDVYVCDGFYSWSNSERIGNGNIVRLKDIKVSQIASGNQHYVFITKDNEVYVAGNGVSYGAKIDTYDVDNNMNKLAKLPDLKAISVACGRYFTILISEENEVYLSGKQDAHYHEIGDVEFAKLDITACRAFTKYSNTVLVDVDDNAYVFGHNYFGQLGLDHCNPVGRPTKIDDLKVLDVKCDSSDHILYIGCGGEVYYSGKMHDYKNTIVPTLLEEFEHYLPIRSSRYGRTKSARKY
jgi:alpha-tubulin suppressor-like RCC1 family protein